MYGMQHFNISYLTIKYSFKSMFFFVPAVLALLRVFVYPRGIYSEPPCMCLGQRNNPKCKFSFRQYFAAIFERWWCFAIKSAVHTSSLNEMLINHSSIQMHFYFHLYLSAYTLW